MQWKEQIERFAPTVQVHILFKATDKVMWGKTSTPTVHLMSYSLLNRKNSVIGTSEVHNFKWDRIVIDEAHMLRNRKSKLFEASMMLRPDIRWALTATPVMNRMTDFVNLMEWIGVSKGLCQREKDKVCSLFLLRRTKDDIAMESPECNVEVKYVPFSSTQEAHLYCKIFHREQTRIQRNTGSTVPNMLEHLLRVRQLCIHPQLYYDGVSAKTQSVAEDWTFPVTKVRELMANLKRIPRDDKAIIFCQFVKEMDFYARNLADAGFNYCRIDGTMSISERQRNVDTFTVDAASKVFLIQINTGGQGINLQMANHVFIMAPNWNPAIEYQAIGRAYRTGQTKPVHVVRFCITSGDPANPFVEENIIELQEKKKRIISSILRDDRIQHDGVRHNMDMSIGLTKEDIYKIFNIHKERS
jgi:SNF2 family DNA or RNA helicase